MKTILPLRYGLVAEVDSDEIDRERFTPPPIERSDHAEDCRCDRCVMVRQAAVQRTRHQ